jgi:hypothetical protein
MGRTNRVPEKVTRISRRIILRQLRDFYEDDDHVQEQDSDPDDDLSSDSSRESIIPEDENLLTSPEANLGELQKWLDNEGDNERARIDWSTDYEQLRKGDAGRLNTMVRGGLNTSVIERIRKDKGPRRAKYEDLLEPLRLETDTGRRKSKKIHKQTYGDMMNALLDWNHHVESARDDAKSRDALLDTLHTRISFLKKTATQRSSADAHNDTIKKILRAIHTYRPETVTFDTQDPFDLLIIILAHIGFVTPDVDDEAKHLIFLTLLGERNYSARTLRKDFLHDLERKTQAAKEKGDAQAVTRYEGRLREWQYGLFVSTANKLIYKIKVARRGVEQNCIQEMRYLKVLQAAQGVAIQERTTNLDAAAREYLVMSIWLEDAKSDCNAADLDLEWTAGERLADLDEYFDVAERRVDDMEKDSRARILTRARKFGGHDLADRSRAERHRIVKQRMTESGTTQMMSDAVVAVTDVRTTASDMLDQLGDIDELLAEMMDAAKTSYRAYDELALLVEAEEEERVAFEREAEETEVVRPLPETMTVLVEEPWTRAALVSEEVRRPRGQVFEAIDETAQEHDDYMREIRMWERKKAWQRSQ